MKRELYNLGKGMYGGYATNLKIWVKEIHDKNHADYIEYRADLHLALDFLKNRLSLHDWNKIKPKTKWGYPRLEVDEVKKMLEGKVNEKV